MPANLPPQYYELEREFRACRDSREKLRLAEELLRIMPKHKGTDKLQAEMKAKISKLKKEIDGGGKTSAGAARQAPTHDFVEREGAGQVILIGAPNSGKSSLVDALTNARVEIADYPYSTREPATGMMDYETIQIQLIDTPPISDESFENYLTNLVRNADLVLLVVDLSDGNLGDRNRYIIDALAERKIILTPDPPAHVDDARYVYKRTLVCGHKVYDDESGNGKAALENSFAGFPTVLTSILDDTTLTALRRTIFQSLRIIRVYTKQIGKPVELVDPVVLPVGGTVEDAAMTIHKDFAEKLKFAKIWGQGKFDGQRVNRDHVLTDGDVVEFHI
ncbi:MAG: GTPase [candidate division Zixibacteria bacterium]|jgi:ribosome-interacting GTPase 1|nr:GTPase [candidate division Zixibacteria bacterium]